MAKETITLTKTGDYAGRTFTTEVDGQTVKVDAQFTGDGSLKKLSANTDTGFGFSLDENGNFNSWGAGAKSVEKVQAALDIISAAQTAE